MLYLITSTPYYRLLQYVLSVTSSDVNPITTQHFKWMHLKSKLYDTSIIVMPVLLPDHHELPFMSLSDNKIGDSFTPALTQCNDELTTILNNDKIDHTGFADIDPDTNYLIQNTLTDSNYFTETQFNKLQCSNDNFSLFNVNIRAQVHILIISDTISITSIISSLSFQLPNPGSKIIIKMFIT